MAIFIIGVILVVYLAARRCLRTLRCEPISREAAGPPLMADGPSGGCC